MPGKGKYAELTKISATRVKKIMQTNEEVGIITWTSNLKFTIPFFRLVSWPSQCQ